LSASNADATRRSLRSKVALAQIALSIVVSPLGLPSLQGGGAGFGGGAPSGTPRGVSTPVPSFFCASAGGAPTMIMAR
jgi:hypothetical protein